MRLRQCRNHKSVVTHLFTFPQFFCCCRCSFSMMNSMRFAKFATPNTKKSHLMTDADAVNIVCSALIRRLLKRISMQLIINNDWLRCYASNGWNRHSTEYRTREKSSCAEVITRNGVRLAQNPLASAQIILLSLLIFNPFRGAVRARDIFTLHTHILSGVGSMMAVAVDMLMHTHILRTNFASILIQWNRM